jgi:hypothetical protein
MGCLTHMGFRGPRVKFALLSDFALVPKLGSANSLAAARDICLRVSAALHSHPPVKPARRNPLTRYGQFRINLHNNPLR